MSGLVRPLQVRRAEVFVPDSPQRSHRSPILVPTLLLTLLPGCPLRGPAPYALDCALQETPLQWTEPWPTRPDELLEPHLGTFDGAGVWVDRGDDAEVALTFGRGSGTPVVLEVVGGRDAERCGDTVWIPVSVALVTGDGQLDLLASASWIQGWADGAVVPGPFEVHAGVDHNAGTLVLSLEEDEEGGPYHLSAALDPWGAPAGEVRVEVESDEARWELPLLSF